jgi:two-component system cell cycle sensor histidine kinase/response regulator CckA
MAENKGSQNRLADLRRQAEERLRKHPPDQGDDTPEQTADLVHELQVHQIELEMQNEELRQAQEKLEASRARYFDLYDLAPVGYFTLSEEGLILEANLTAATLLGVPRGSLAKRPIVRFLFRGDQDRSAGWREGSAHMSRRDERYQRAGAGRVPKGGRARGAAPP